MSRAFQCDRCGVAVPGKPALEVDAQDPDRGRCHGVNPFPEHIDQLCEKCKNEYMKFMDNYHVSPTRTEDEA